VHNAHKKDEKDEALMTSGSSKGRGGQVFFVRFKASGSRFPGNGAAVSAGPAYNNLLSCRIRYPIVGGSQTSISDGRFRDDACSDVRK
jgi:hypothetical protein